jgi:tetratricopeptide (TPR) repeat protein
VRGAIVLAPAAAAAAILLASVAAGVGGLAQDRADASLAAAAVRSWSDEALAARQAGALEPAARLLRRAAAVRPGHAPTQYRLGILERELGREAEALAAFERAAAIDPSLEIPAGADRD